MARIVGVDIPRNKKVPYSLCYIHGIGLATAKRLCEDAKVDVESRVQDLYKVDFWSLIWIIEMKIWTP